MIACMVCCLPAMTVEKAGSRDASTIRTIQGNRVEVNADRMVFVCAAEHSKSTSNRHLPVTNRVHSVSDYLGF